MTAARYIPPTPTLSSTPIAREEWARGVIGRARVSGWPDPVLLDRLEQHLIDIGMIGADAPGMPAARAVKRPRQRKPSIDRLAAKAKKLGVALTIEPNGAVTVRADNSAPNDKTQSELDEWIARHAH